MRGVTLPGFPRQSTVRTTGWGTKQQRIKGENEATMNNPGKAEWSSLNSPPTTNSKHAQPTLEREEQAHKGLGETRAGDMEQQTHQGTVFTFLTPEDV